MAEIWNILGFPKSEPENANFWTACKVANESTWDRNLSSDGDATTQLRAAARATARGMCVAEVWNIFGCSKSELENENFSTERNVANESTGDRNLNSDGDATAHMRAAARATA